MEVYYGIFAEQTRGQSSLLNGRSSLLGMLISICDPRIGQFVLSRVPAVDNPYAPVAFPCHGQSMWFCELQVVSSAELERGDLGDGAALGTPE